jgi:spore maturation protein CgeB
MSFKLLIISSMYRGYLASFNKRFPEIEGLSYSSQSEKLLNESYASIGSYIKVYRELGIEVECVITNARFLQKAWKAEKGFEKYNSKEIVFNQVKEFKPDVLMIEDIDFTERKWVEKIRTSVTELKLVIASHCAPYNLAMLENFQNLDFVITCTPGLKIDLEQSGIKVYLVYHGFDPTILNKIIHEKDFVKNDLIFSGSLFTGGGFHDKRISFLDDVLKQNIDLKIYANLEKSYKTIAKKFIYILFRILKYLNLRKSIHQIPVLRNYQEFGVEIIKSYSGRLRKAIRPPVFGKEMFRLLMESSVILNIHGEVAGDYAGNVRLFEATGVGSCLLTDNKRNIGELFEVGKEIIVFDGIDDCIKKIKWISEHEDERVRIAKAGQLKTLKSHTVEQRCREIIRILITELAERSK